MSTGIDFLRQNIMVPVLLDPITFYLSSCDV